MLSSVAVTLSGGGHQNEARTTEMCLRALISLWLMTLSAHQWPLKTGLRAEGLSSFFSILLTVVQGGLIIPALSAKPNSLHGLYLIKQNPGF